MATTKGNYVQFMRGTPASYAKITPDPDVLYFISEKNATTGKLYLGSKLIAGLDDTSDQVKALSDLSDVLIKAAELETNSFLVYDEDQGKWVVKDAKAVASMIITTMVGATADADGSAGYVPAPTKNDVNKFLRGDGTWADPTTDVQNDISAIKQSIQIIQGNDGGKSIREIATGVLTEELIPENAKASLDTLKEIADWIQSHPDDASAMNTRIGTLENNIFDVTDETTGEVTKIGLVTQVGNLSTELSTLQTTVTNLTTDVRDAEADIVTLYDKLKWQEMED